MTLDPNALAQDADILEQIEKATLRMVVQAVYDFRDKAREFFLQEPDLVADIGEDITREAMDRMGTSIIPARLFGKIDYKRAARWRVQSVQPCSVDIREKREE